MKNYVRDNKKGETKQSTFGITRPAGQHPRLSTSTGQGRGLAISDSTAELASPEVSHDNNDEESYPGYGRSKKPKKRARCGCKILKVGNAVILWDGKKNRPCCH